MIEARATGIRTTVGSASETRTTEIRVT